MADGDKPKIIVDEDWKTKVQAEKEQLERNPGPPPPETSDRTAGRTALPPPSLNLLATMLATQAMVALGQVPLPGEEPSPPRFDEAMHLIDLLQVVEDKTINNRTADETKMLDGLLHELRMAFVAIQTQTKMTPVR